MIFRLLNGNVELQHHWSIRQFVDAVARSPLAHQPGTVWEYSIATDVLGRVVEAASGQRLAEFLSDRLFKPLAFTKTFTMAAAAFLSITLGPALILLMTGRKVIPEHKHPVSRLLHRLKQQKLEELLQWKYLHLYY